MRGRNQESKTQLDILSQKPTVSASEQALRVSIQGEETTAEQDRSARSDIERIDVGFTGTRRGMTDWQKQKVRHLLKQLANDRFVTVHHGDCTGSDEEFHNIIGELWKDEFPIAIEIHPPVNNKLRAYCVGSKYHPTKPYKIRNADIVRASDLLIATPHRHEKDGSQIYSGTWATVRIARQRKVPYVIYYADGRREGGNKWKRLLRSI